ncbi:uncharacterized protein LOC109543944 [Dendroctonus ponderosae]|uniref:MATH domain-containing protein n=1 Tax=Dendroctonus ponderosae TaxID=77166 RepID=A0AAR5Q8H6_DENPD|nr:uncharacterized protein LOC109543944 [Dendroctonus ponderosae]
MLSFWTCLVLISLIKPVVNVPLQEGLPLETQFAVCKVVTKEIEATAKATITRQLKGVCSSSEVNRKFAYLQQELRNIKHALDLIYGENIRYKSLELDATTVREASTTQLPIEPHLEDDAVEMNSQLQSPQEEIANFNDTIVETDQGDLYFYYWKLQGISKILRKTDLYISSPPFSLLGHTIFLQFYPNYVGEQIGLLMKPQSSSFLKKHKFYVLGQINQHSQIASRLLYGMKNDEKMFKVEAQMLDSFIWRDSLLIKIEIQVNS